MGIRGPSVRRHGIIRSVNLPVSQFSPRRTLAPARGYLDQPKYRKHHFVGNAPASSRNRFRNTWACQFCGSVLASIINLFFLQLPTEDVKVCRLACRGLDALALPFVYNAVHIYLNRIDRYQRNLSVLKAIVSPEGRKLSIGKHVKHLWIHSHSDNDGRPKHQVVWNGIIKSQRRLEERIYVTLPSMVALKKITCVLVLSVQNSKR